MNLNPDASKALFYQDYTAKVPIDGVRFLDLRRLPDDGGSFTELLRRPQLATSTEVGGIEVKQVNYSVIEPGVIRAYHLHPKQTDVWFVPPSDRLLMVLIDVRADSPTEGLSMRFMLGYGASRMVVIPPGVAHGCKNLGDSDGRIIYFVDHTFMPEPPLGQEGRLPWDYLGAEVWDMVRG